MPAVSRHDTNHKDWTVVVDLRLLGVQPVDNTERLTVVPTQKVKLTEATMLFPLLQESASHEVWDDRIVSTFGIESRVLVRQPRFLTGYPAFTRLGAWDVHDVSTNTLRLHVELPMICWETRIDEKAAARYGWPKGPWPEDVALCLEPQLLVESTSPEIDALTKRWLSESPGGADPRRTPPYVLAKYLTGRVVAHYQPTGNTIDTRGRGRNSLNYSGSTIAGFAVLGAAAAARDGRGPPLDGANLLTAVLRAAGIPARLVIGYDVQIQQDQEQGKQGGGGGGLAGFGGPPMHSWVEFLLYNEAAGRGEWVPADVRKQREFSSRPPPLNQRWLFFGHHEGLDMLCPIAFHWLPPTVCMNSGSPALWGWVPDPESVHVDPDIRIFARATARRADDPPRSTPAPGGKMRPKPGDSTR